MKENDKICMTVREASRYSGLGEHLLRRMIEAGKLPAFNVGPKSIIMRDTLVEFRLYSRFNGNAN